MSTSRPEDAPRDDESLIDRWLDEGDRLSESAVTSVAGKTVQKQHRLAAALADLRTMAERRRLAVVLSSVAAAALAVVALRAISHAVLGTGSAVASDPPRPATRIPIPSPPDPVPVAAAALAPDPVPVPVAAAALAPDPMPVAAAALAPDPVPVAAATRAAVDRPPATAAPASTASAAVAAAVPEASTKPAAARPNDPRQECETSLRRERAKEALIACEKVARDNATSADAQILLARADLLAGRDRDTLRLARRASALDPQCADAYLLIGSVHQAAGRRPDARTAYESYLHTAPHGSHAAELRAILKTL